MKSMTKTKKDIQTKFATKHFRVGVILPKKGEDLFLQMAEAMCELGFVVSVMGSMKKELIDLSEKHEGQLEVFEDTATNEKQILKQSDVVLFLEVPTAKKLESVMKKGIVPIVPFGSDIINFDAQAETGNGFCFSEGNFYELFATVVRAFENYKFAYDWGNLRKKVKKSV